MYTDLQATSLALKVIRGGYGATTLNYLTTVLAALACLFCFAKQTAHTPRGERVGFGRLEFRRVFASGEDLVSRQCSLIYPIRLRCAWPDGPLSSPVEETGKDDRGIRPSRRAVDNGDTALYYRLCCYFHF